MNDNTIAREGYASITAYLRAREETFAGSDGAERMLAAEDFKGACAVAEEFGLPDMSEMSMAEVEKTLSDRLSFELGDIANMCPDTVLADIFRLKYDYHNAKCMVKSSGKTANPMSESGTISATDFYEGFVIPEKIGVFPASLLEAMRDAKANLSRTGNPSLADSILDKAYFAELIRMCETTGHPYVIGYGRLLVDAANLRIFVRAIKAGRHAEIVKDLFIDGGTVGINQLSEGVLTPDSSIVSCYGGTVLADAAAKGAAVLAGESISVFEQAVDNGIISYLADGERKGFGPEAVISYLAGLEYETMALRIVLTGRLMNIDPATLKERLRDSYV